MNICVIRTDQGDVFAQIGTNAKSLEELRKLCEQNGEECVDFVEITPDHPGGKESLGALEILCSLNNEGLGCTIEGMLLQMYQAGLAKGHPA